MVTEKKKKLIVIFGKSSSLMSFSRKVLMRSHLVIYRDASWFSRRNADRVNKQIQGKSNRIEEFFPKRDLIAMSKFSNFPI